MLNFTFNVACSTVYLMDFANVQTNVKQLFKIIMFTQNCINKCSELLSTLTEYTQDQKHTRNFF